MENKYHNLYLVKQISKWNDKHEQGRLWRNGKKNKVFAPADSDIPCPLALPCRRCSGYRKLIISPIEPHYKKNLTSAKYRCFQGTAGSPKLVLI